MRLALTLASRNLFHDRLRFIATLVGIVFSVVLVMIQMILDLLILGFGINAFVSAARMGRQRRSAGEVGSASS